MNEMSRNITSNTNNDIEILRSNNAILSFLAGILGFTFLPFLGSLLALILGYKAEKEIDLNWGKIGGRQFARIGIILGWLGIGFHVLLFFLAGIVVVSAVLFLCISMKTSGFSSITAVKMFNLFSFY